MKTSWMAFGLASTLALATACGDNLGLGEPGAAGEPGSDGALTLVKTTELPVGDGNCPAGGTRIDVGTDDGAGAETAGDGILGGGEIDDTSFVCNGEPEIPVGPLDPPAGPAGQYSINASGGAGSDGGGGPAGPINLSIPNGTGGGSIKLFSTGRASANFDVPSFDPYLGDNPVTVSADTTVFNRAAADNTGLVDGSLLRRDAAPGLLQFDGATDVVVTGLRLDAGATLTVESLNATAGTLSVPEGMVIAGTLTGEFQANGRDRKNLNLQCASMVTEASASFDFSGGPGDASTPGGNGGNLIIIATDPLPSGGPGGLMVNRAATNTSGGDGQSGGNGGVAAFLGGAGAVNVASIVSSGGTGSGLAGGNAGVIVVQTIGSGNASNAADLTANGGAGMTTGGNGGPIQVFAVGGSSLNRGAISSSGGDSSVDCLAACQGGAGGSTVLLALGGSLRSNGSVHSRGGDAPAGTGGSGGGLVLQANDFGGPVGSLPAGDIRISGELVYTGGTGEVGGGGGALTASLSTGFPYGQEIIFYGYLDIAIAGGAGTTSGGPGAPFIAQLGPTPLPPPAASGSIVIEPPLTTSGGGASAGSGGPAGPVTLNLPAFVGIGQDQQFVITRGDLNARGGDGTTTGGPGAPVVVRALDGLIASGSWNVSGGNGTDGGGPGGFLDIEVAGGDVLFEGALMSASGGACTADGCAGGPGGNVLASGLGLLSSADFAVGGGDASATGGTGGNAGNIVLNGFASGAASSAVNVDIAGGTGATPGTDGAYVVGGVDLSGQFLP